MKKTEHGSDPEPRDEAEAPVSPEEFGQEELVNDEPVDETIQDGSGPTGDTEVASAVEEDSRDAQIADLTAECDGLKDQLLRMRAEFETSRRRLAREAERTARAAGESLFRELLPVVDNLELALQHAPDRSDSLAQGVELVLKQICDVLAKNGVEPIPAVGEVFNPHCHEAMTHAESDAYPENVVAEEYQRGYRMGDQVLRPTKVGVSSGKPAEVNNTDEPESLSSGNGI